MKKAVWLVLTAATFNVQAQDECTWPDGSSSFATAPVEEVRACLRAGFDPNMSVNWPPLHRAAHENPDPAVIEALIAAGADPNRKTTFATRDSHERWTPLFFAASFNPNPDVIRALIAGGANPDARCSQDENALWHAAEHNDNPEIITALIEAGLDPNVVDRYGEQPPLMVAIFEDRPASVVAALLQGGADPNVRIETSAWPLYAAVGRCLIDHDRCTANITALLEAGADANMRDRDGITVLHIAMMFDYERDMPNVIDALLDAGANPALRDTSGNTPADIPKERRPGERRPVQQVPLKVPRV